MIVRLLLFLSINTNTCPQNEVLHVSYDFSLNLGGYKSYASILSVSEQESLFKWGTPTVELSSETEFELSVELGENDSIGNYNYIDKSIDSLYTREFTINSKGFIVAEAIPEIAWKISKESKKIGPYLCQKAITAFRGRNYTAWFTRDLPINSGPWKLQGLPGLILIASDDSGEVSFTVRSISKGHALVKPDLSSMEHKTLEAYKEFQRSLSGDFTRKISSKMPREIEINVTVSKGLEIFE